MPIRIASSTYNDDGDDEVSDDDDDDHIFCNDNDTIKSHE